MATQTTLRIVYMTNKLGMVVPIIGTTYEDK